jgi:5-methylcytosine-specific restriction endonuclease McrA
MQLLRADPHCFYCGRELTEATATFDHYRPRSKGGRATRDNGRLACATCNVEKGDQWPPP